MNKKSIIIVLVLIAAGIFGVNYLRQSQSNKHSVSSASVSETPPDVSPSVSSSASLVPAHYESAPSNLPTTLAPEKFPGKIR